MTICNINSTNPKVFGVGGIITDFIIDIYVTIRLIYILKNANKNADQFTSNINHYSQPLCIGIFYDYQYLLSFILRVLQVAFFNDEQSITVKCIIYIALSYVITVDVEIVQAIKGKNQKKGSSTNPKKSNQPQPDY